MKKSTFKFVVMAMFFFIGTVAFAQVTISPENATAFDEITLTLDTKASCPADALYGMDSVMMHSGVTIGEDSWQDVVSYDGFGADGQQPKLINNGDSTWSITFTPSEFYGIEEGTAVSAINCVFNNGSWDAEGKAFAEDESCVDFTVELAGVGISENNARTFNIYPNPVNNELTISNIEKGKKVEIFNVTGQIVKSVEISTSKVKIDVSELQTGVYFVNVHNNTGVETAKFVKN